MYLSSIVRFFFPEYLTQFSLPYLYAKISSQLYGLCLMKIFFINYCFSYIEFKLFLNMFSFKIYNLFFSKILETNVLIVIDRKKIFVNNNYKECFFRMIYTKIRFFPKLISFFSLKKNKILRNNLEKFNKKKSTFFFLLNDIINSDKFTPNVQLILFLKNTGIIKNSVYKNEIKISYTGIKFLLNSLNLNFFKFLENFCNKISSVFQKEMNFQDRKFRIFSYHEKMFNKMNSPRLFVKKKKLFELLIEFQQNRINAPKLIEELDKTNVLLFSLFHQFKILFFPCFFDKIFYIFPNQQKRKIFIHQLYKKIKTKECFQMIIESNYRVYAYNNNPFLNKILTQFCDLIYNLPGLFVGEINKMSINKATRKGISAKNIISFILKNSHHIDKNFPNPIINQIRIWEFQQKKTSTYDCLMLTDNIIHEHKNASKQTLSHLYIFKKKINFHLF
nr:TATA binding protein of transcription factor IIB-like protein [Cryptomonas paramecium]